MGRKATGETVRAACWDGTWRVVRTFTDPATGRRVRRVEQAVSREEAETAADIGQHAIDTRTTDRLRDGQAPATIGTLLDSLVIEYEGRAREGKIRPATEAWTRCLAGLVSASIGRTSLAAIRMDTGQRYAAARLNQSVKPRSVWAELRVLRTALLFAVERHWWTPPPNVTIRGMFRDLRPEQLGELTEIHWLRGDEVAPFLATVHNERNPSFGVMCQIALHTGMRQAEIMALQWEDWHRRDREIRIRREKPAIDYKTKAGKARSVPVNEDLAVVLLAEWMRQGQPRGEAWMILSVKGTRRVGGDWVTRLVTRCSVAAGVTRITFHGLRHTFASLALESNAMSLMEVSRILGHADPGFTARLYVHVSRQKLADGTSRLAEFYRAMPARIPAILQESKDATPR